MSRSSIPRHPSDDGPRIPSSLGRHVGNTPATDDDLHRLHKAAWHRHGALSLKVDDIRDDWLRQALINLGTDRYGSRQPSARK